MLRTHHYFNSSISYEICQAPGSGNTACIRSDIYSMYIRVNKIYLTPESLV